MTKWPMNWQGPAAWGKKEAKAGDRLPYASHLDDRTLRLRDGGLMQVLAIAGLPFETEDADQLNHMLGVREVMLRSALDGRFILYHHIVRRQVGVALPAQFDSPFAAELDRQWAEKLADRQLFYNEQFITLVRRPARGKAGWPERFARMFKRGLDPDAGAEDPALLRELDAATRSLLSTLQPYGARQLTCYRTREGVCSEPLELLSALYNGEMRPVLRPADDVDLGHHIPYRRISFGLDTLELQGPGAHSFAGVLSVKDYPATTRAGLIDGVLRLGSECVLTESFAPADRQIARERMDLAIRRLRAADDDTATERREMLSAKDALVSGQTGFRRSSPQPAGPRAFDALARSGAGGRGIGAGRYRRGGGARGCQPGTGLLGAVPRQRGLCRAPRADFDQQCGRLHLAARFSAGDHDGQPLGPGDQPVRNHQRDALFLQLSRCRLRPFHRDRPLRLGQDGGARISSPRRRRSWGHGPFSSTRIAAPKSSSARLAGIMRSWSRASRPASTRCNCPTLRSTAHSSPIG